MKKPVTIKDVEETDKLYLDKLAKANGKSLAETFGQLVKDSENLKVIQSKLEKTEQEKAEIQSKLDKLQSEFNTLSAEHTAVSENYDSQIEDNKKQADKIRELQLTGSQFVCEFDPETARNARKVRKFIVADGHVTAEDYPNQLANFCVKRFITRNYSDLL